LQDTTRAPIEHNYSIWSDGDKSTVNKSHYQRLVEKLIYLVHARQKIAHLERGQQKNSLHFQCGQLIRAWFMTTTFTSYK